MAALATEKQVAFATTLGNDLKALAAGYPVDGEIYAARAQTLQDVRDDWKGARADRRAMSALIDTMIAAKRNWTAQDREAAARATCGGCENCDGEDLCAVAPKVAGAEPGYYTDGEAFFVVVANRAKTATYAKRLVFTEAANGAMRPGWEYAPGVGKTLAGLVPMTLAQAAALGHAHGYCIVCSRQLTDPASVEAGIGPVCAKRFAA